MTTVYAATPDLPSALAISQAAWTSLRCSPQPQCDVAQVTKQWYPIIGLSDLISYAVIVQSGDFFQGETITLPNGKTFTLTANQIASLQTRAQMGTLLADILKVALVASRVLPAETTAINAYANTHPTFKANYTTLTSGPIDLQNPLTDTVFGELVTAGVLTADRIAIILAPQPVSPINGDS